MSALVPLNNGFAQNSVNFNNQTPLNASGLFRYKINPYSSDSHVFTVQDVNAICVFDTSANITIAAAGFTSDPPVGAEILFYSTLGYIKLNTASATLYSAEGNYTLGPNWLGKIIYKGSNQWFFSSSNFDSYVYYWDDCCSYLNREVYQIKALSDSEVFLTSQRSYADSNLTIPFNGTVYSSSTSEYYNIINGHYDALSSCSTNTYSTAYTFYSGSDPIADAVTFYSVSGLDISSISSLAGNKFFTSDVGSQFDCYTMNAVSASTQSTYYSSTANYPGSPLIFQDGYIINIDSYL